MSRVVSGLAVAAVVAGILVEVLNGLHLLQGIGFVSDALAGVPIDPSSADQYDQTGAVLAAAWVVALVAGAIAVLVWLERAFSHAASLTGTPRVVSRAMAVLYWFIPILSFYKPAVVVRGLWNRLSTPVHPRRDRVVVAWWLLWVFGLVASRVGTQAFDSGVAADQLGFASTGLAISAFGAGLCALAGVLLIAVIVEIEARLGSLAKPHTGAAAGAEAPSVATPLVPLHGPAPGPPPTAAIANYAEDSPPSIGTGMEAAGVRYCPSCGRARAGRFCAACGMDLDSWGVRA